MLDGAEAFTVREPDVVGCHVVLEVDEGLSARFNLEDRRWRDV